MEGYPSPEARSACKTGCRMSRVLYAGALIVVLPSEAREREAVASGDLAGTAARALDQWNAERSRSMRSWLRFDRECLESSQPPVRVSAHHIHRNVGLATPVYPEVGEGRLEGRVQCGESLHL